MKLYSSYSLKTGVSPGRIVVAIFDSSRYRYAPKEGFISFLYAKNMSYKTVHEIPITYFSIRFSKLSGEIDDPAYFKLLTLVLPSNACKNV